jgi:hypothetical protein
MVARTFFAVEAQDVPTMKGGYADEKGLNR